MWLREHPCCKVCANCTGKVTQKTRNLLYAAFCGSLVAIAWWCFIDAACVYTADFGNHSYFVVPGIGSTLAFIVINVLAKMPLMNINLTYMTRSSMWCLRFILFIAFFVSFSMVIASLLLFCLKVTIEDSSGPAIWSYFFSVPQTLLICIATFLFYFGIDIENLY